MDALLGARVRKGGITRALTFSACALHVAVFGCEAKRHTASGGGDVKPALRTEAVDEDEVGGVLVLGYARWASVGVFFALVLALRTGSLARMTVVSEGLQGSICAKIGAG